jgi:hypothetical protein
MATAEERYEAKVDRSVGVNGCHPWTAFCNDNGYGMFWSGEKRANGGPVMVLAHRWGYAHYVGKIPEDHGVLHTCDNPGCQNKRHWFTGTQEVNNDDMLRKGRRNGPIGEDCHRAKLTEEDVIWIRSEWPLGEWSQGDMARLFDVEQSTVSAVVNRRTWKHL